MLYINYSDHIHLTIKSLINLCLALLPSTSHQQSVSVSWTFYLGSLEVFV